MKSRLLFGRAAGLAMLFAVAHTVGHITRHDVSDPRAREIQQVMIDNKSDMHGQMRSDDENYAGMR